MINIRFPDGAVRSYAKGSTPMAVAKSIAEGLAKKVIAASIDGVDIVTGKPNIDRKSTRLNSSHRL